MSDSIQFEVNITTVKNIFQEIVRFVRPRKRYIITVKEWEKRGLSANAQYHVWVKQISEYTGEDLKTVECQCKLYHGLPIALAGENGPMISWMLESANFYAMDDYSQLMFVSGLEITRNFTTKEHNQYRDSIQRFWNDNGLNLQYRN